MSLPRRRRPISPERQATVNDAMVPGAFRGRLPVVAPVAVRKRQDARSRGITAVVDSTARSSQIDVLPTLTVAGAQDLDLTYLPLFDSWNVSISGLSLLNGTHYTISGQVLSLLTAAGARVGEVVEVQYDYLTGLPAPATEPTPLNIPFRATGWKYHEMTSSGDLANYVDPAYNDSAWSVGQAPLGIGAYVDVDGHAKATTVPSGNTGGLGHVSDFVVRRIVGPGTGIVLTIDETNYCAAYVGGVFLDGRGTGNQLKFTAAVPDQSLPWLLAVYITVANGATAGGVDIKVEGTAL